MCAGSKRRRTSKSGLDGDAPEAEAICVALRPSMVERLPLSVCRIVGSYIPLMKARIVYPFLALRTTCRQMLLPGLILMAYRVCLYKSNMAGYKAARRIMLSGFLHQCWLPFADSKERETLRRARLIYNQPAFTIPGHGVFGGRGLPDGMTQEYFDAAQRRGTIFGWRDGRFHL